MNKDKLVALIDSANAGNSGEINRASGLPFRSPAKLGHFTLDDKFQFNCHSEVACFNRCCRQVEIQLTPYDILRLKKRLAINSREFVATYTFPFEMVAQGMPGLRLTQKPGTSECIFLTEEGCSVYNDRPTACRYYPLANLGMRRKDNSTGSAFFLVKEDHCLGHNEQKTQTIREYLHEQGAAHYDLYNEDWREIVNKKRLSSPSVGQLSDRSMQLLDMCSYDIDSFRDFIQGTGFLGAFDIDEHSLNILLNNDEELLLFAMRFLKQVLFGEKTIRLRQDTKEIRNKTHEAIAALEDTPLI